MAFISNAFRTAYDIAFQVSPIILVGGIASTMFGQQLPIIGLTGQLAGLAQGLFSSGLPSTADAFATFLPIPGSTLINNTIGTYPFANQQVAANAIIQQPLNLSLQMIAPVKDTGGYLTKLAIFTALQKSLVQHNNAGGTYNVATPAFIYTNGILLNMTDITSGVTAQKQIEYQLDFTFPIITQQQAANAYNSKMGQIAAGQQVGPSQLLGSSNNIGQNASPTLGQQYSSAVTFPYGTQPGNQ